MSVIRAVVTVNDDSVGTITATRARMCDDGYDTYNWEWGIIGASGYLQMSEGTVTHRECDGAFTLIQKVLGLIRGRW